ncbi:MAG TPA: cell division protein FtsH, partial [Lactobacillus acetotolerans]|nr:cell division protein FtsH [Lactobacillus acetotolerans]
MKNNRNRLFSNGLFYIVVFLLLLWGINWALGGSNSSSSSQNISYSEFVKDLNQGKVKNFSVQPANGVYTVSGSYKKAQKSKSQSKNSFDFFNSGSGSQKVTSFSTTMLQNDASVKKVQNLAQKNSTRMTNQGESQSG